MLPRRITRNASMAFVSAEEVRIAPWEILREIASHSHRNGEPGYAFIDRVNEQNPLPGVGRIESSNPCGEQFLHDGDVCNLGSLNLARFVRGCDDPTIVDWSRPGDPDTEVDWARLGAATRTAVRMLDDVVDLSEHPVERVNVSARGNRRVGHGGMGLADALTLLRVPYDSQQGRDVASRFMRTIKEQAVVASEQLARERGPFPNIHLSVWKDGTPRRNAALTNVAPTGTTSMIADVNGGLEPYFMLAYDKQNILGGVRLRYVNRYLEAALKAHQAYTDDVLDAIVSAGSLRGIEHVPELVRRAFVTAMDIATEDHVLMQAAFQAHLCNAASKTNNLPNAATVEDVERTILLAWRAGLKGCTIYRDGSRVVQVLAAVSPGPSLASSTAGTASPTSSASPSTSGTASPAPSGALCPDCGDALRFEEGCHKCPGCGYGKCSL
jgi:ribonucleoside-diphosphate reductase alpha chain